MKGPCGGSLDRRRSVKGIAAGLALAPFSGSLIRPVRRPRAKSRVALVRTGDRKDGVRRVLKLFAPESRAYADRLRPILSQG
jgi:hypothetical protein